MRIVGGTPLEVIDAHTHLSGDSCGRTLGIMERNRIDVMIDVTPNDLRSLERKTRAFAAHPGRLFACCGVDPAGFGSSRWIDGALRDLAVAVAMGAVGVKFAKEWGLRHADGRGALIPIDHPLLEPLYEAAGRLGVPVIFHAADPRAFFEPVDGRNERLEDVRLFFYDIDYTLGDPLGDDCLCFHAHYRRENPTRQKMDYAFLPRVEGRGRFLGVNAGVIADRARFYNSWWGEGEVKCYIDGDEENPTLCGTGTEDYLGTGWGLKRFIAPYQGCTLADSFNMQYCFYRHHVPDPVYFAHDIAVTIQQIGCWGPDTKPLLRDSGRPVHYARPGLQRVDFSESGDQGKYGLFERQDDWSSCAYFYLDRPGSGLPSMDPLAKRVEGLLDL